jgi:hypothetical protein
MTFRPRTTLSGLFLALLCGLVLSTLAVPARAQTQEPAGAEPTGAEPTGADPTAAEPRRFQVWLWTMDQGDQVYELFGHNALVIADAWTGQTLAWNWGLFNFEDEDFLSRFLRGTMRYSMGPAYPDDFLESYRRANRTVFQHRIYLTDDEATALDALVRWNFEPANRPYIYDYFRDNCSTRVRDALDQVLGGALRAHFEPRPYPWSYRDQSRHLVQGTAWVDQGLSFLLGSRGDYPRSEYEATFVPHTLMVLLEGFERTLPDGTRVPLLGEREILFQSSRPPLPATPPPFSWGFLLFGLGGMGFLAGASRVGSLRGVGAVLGGGWAAGSGALGGLLVFSLFTDHVFMHWNLNLLQVSPIHLGLAVLLPWVHFTGRGAPLLRAGAHAAVALSVAGLALQGSGLMVQGNADVLAWTVPMNVGLVLLARALAPATGAAGVPSPTRIP